MILSLNIFHHSDNYHSQKRQYFSINVLKSLVEEEDPQKFGSLTIGDINIDEFLKDIDKEDIQYNITKFTDQEILGKIWYYSKKSFSNNAVFQKLL